MQRNTAATIAFGYRLGRLRRDRNWTVATLAERTELEPQQIEQIEAGRVSPVLEELRALAGGLELNFSRLMELDELKIGLGASSLERARLVGNLMRALGHLTADGPAIVLAPGMAVEIPGPLDLEFGVSGVAWPDVVVVCEEPLTHCGAVLVNPAFVVEVLTPEIERAKRDEIVEAYLSIDSLLDCLIVDLAAIRVEHHQRADAGDWQQHDHGPGELVQLRALAGGLAVDDLYRGWSAPDRT